MSFATSLYAALTDINVPKDQAREVVEALEQKMTSEFATKSDIALIRKDIEVLRDEVVGVDKSLRTEIHLVEHRLLTRLGGLMVTLFGLMFAALSWVG